ncbi:4Fe-4S binding protein [Desulfocurvibacter africanus]|uniref:4Fe-4S binding protein n=1 Tax=Desulfocurvibacter africanus TaxID=873 RepID=UPI0004039102|nr:4Fe-4S binding protein [Desulfocurvibacter africanus]
MQREDWSKGFVIEACRGVQACPHRAVDGAKLARGLRQALEALSPAERIKAKLGPAGVIRAHDCFRVSLSCCPNGCSRPQIADIGFIGAAEVVVTPEPCHQCGACLEACRENAVSLDAQGPILDEVLCVRCGACAKVCPSDSLAVKGTGWRAMLGGRLGRHPRLAQELPDLLTESEAVALAVRCLTLHLDQARRGERFGALLERLEPAERGQPGLI